MALVVHHGLFTEPDSLEAILNGHEDDPAATVDSDDSGSSKSNSTGSDEILNATISCNQIIDLDDKSSLRTYITTKQDKSKTEIYPFLYTGPYIKEEKVKTQKKKFLRCPFDTCNRMFLHEAFYKSHLILHRNKNFECKYCSKVFRDKNQLLKHQPVHRYKDGRWKFFQCAAVSCYQVFLSLQLLHKHEVSAHNLRLQHYRCRLCLKPFELKYLYLRHRRTHYTPIHKCIECGKMFKYLSNLKAHAKIHTNCESYACEQCGLEFNKTTNLKRHKAIHIGKNYFCKICFANFSNKTSLTKHTNKNHPIIRKSEVNTGKREQSKC